MPLLPFSLTLLGIPLISHPPVLSASFNSPSRYLSVSHKQTSYLCEDVLSDLHEDRGQRSFCFLMMTATGFHVEEQTAPSIKSRETTNAWRNTAGASVFMCRLNFFFSQAGMRVSGCATEREGGSSPSVPNQSRARPPSNATCRGWTVCRGWRLMCEQDEDRRLFSAVKETL